MAVTLKDIAELAHVSRQAVSAALNGSGASRVSPETRARIVRIARDLNYVPNFAAVMLNRGGSDTIGILGTYGSPLHESRLNEVCRQLHAMGRNCIIQSIMPGISTFSRSYASLISRGVGGVLVMTDSSHPANWCPELPTVFVAGGEGSDVRVDRRAMGETAVRHLIGHGHRRIGAYCLASSQGVFTEGWRTALEQRGLYEPELLVPPCSTGRELGDYLKRHRITALAVRNDFIACRLIRSLQEEHWRIPEDLAVVGCDGMEFADFLTPTLTTVLQPVRSFAEKSVRLLLERMEKHDCTNTPAAIVIPPRLLPGGSCGCPERHCTRLHRLNTPAMLESSYLLNYGENIFDSCCGTEAAGIGETPSS